MICLNLWFNTIDHQADGRQGLEASSVEFDIEAEHFPQFQTQDNWN